MPLFTSKQLSNEEYHKLPQFGGSVLAQIYFDSAADYKFGEKEKKKPLVFGTSAHACILEPSLFSEQFIRGISKEENKDALDTNKQMESWLKDRGIKGYSNRTKCDLMGMIFSAEHNVKIIEIMEILQEIENPGKSIVKPDDFDNIKKMRNVIFGNKKYRELLTSGLGHFEYSCVRDELKCRWDRVTHDGIILDYKTSRSSKRKDFGRLAADCGYWLKMALQHDMFEEEFGDAPKQVLLLAQSKSSPFIPKCYEMTKEQLRIGRKQYRAAHDLLKRCLDNDVWPDYGAFDEEGKFHQQEDIEPLDTPSYLAYEYGMEEEVEIEYL